MYYFHGGKYGCMKADMCSRGTKSFTTGPEGRRKKEILGLGSAFETSKPTPVVR